MDPNPGARDRNDDDFDNNFFGFDDDHNPQFEGRNDADDPAGAAGHQDQENQTSDHDTSQEGSRHGGSGTGSDSDLDAGTDDDDVASAVDPEERYPELTPEEGQIAFDYLGAVSKRLVLRLEAAGINYCGMLWEFFYDFFPDTPFEEINRISTAGSIFGIDRALEVTVGHEQPALLGMFRKNRENSKKVFKVNRQRQNERIEQLRQYYEAIIRPLTDAVYLQEKRNQYQTNLFGIVFNQVLVIRRLRTEAFRRDQEALQSRLEKKEQELQELLQKSIEDSRAARETQERENRLKDLDNRIGEVKKKQTGVGKASAPASSLPARPTEVVFDLPPRRSTTQSVDDRIKQRVASLIDQGRSDCFRSVAPASVLPPRRETQSKSLKSIFKNRAPRSEDDSPLRMPAGRTQQVPTKVLDDLFQEDDVHHHYSSDSSDSDFIPRDERSGQRGSPFRSRAARKPEKSKDSPSGLVFPKFGNVATKRIETIRKKKDLSQEKTDKERLDDLARAMSSNGMTSGYFTETNMTSAALLMKFMDEYMKGSKSRRKSEQEFETEEINHELQDLSLQSFDFNVSGVTPEDILGPKFMRTTFPDELSRVETMRAILQYVLDHPGCRFPTRGIVLNMLGEFDMPRQTRTNFALSTLQTMDAIASPYSEGMYDDSLISPPLLGLRSCYGSSLSKGVFSALGLSTDEKFCLEDLLSKPLNLYLPSLKRIIEAEQLCSDSAFTLLLSVLKGDCFDEVHSHMIDGSRSFEEVWMSLQKTCGRVVHTGGLEKSIKEILSKPPVSYPAALARLQNLRTKGFAHVRDKRMRQAKISEAAFEDFRTLIRTFMPLESVSIDWAYRSKKAAYDEELRLKQLQGISPDKIRPFDCAQIYKEIICGYLASEVGSSPFPQVILQNQPSFPKKLTISEADLKPILKTNASGSAEEPDMSQASSHSETERSDRGRPVARSQGSNRSQGGSRSGSARSYNQDQPRPQQWQNRPYNNYNNGYSNGGYNNASGGYNNAPRSRESSAGRGPGQMYIPVMASQTLNDRTCYLCKMTGHLSFHCTLYPGDTIKEGPPCTQCGAFHSAPCKSQMRNEVNQPRYLNDDGTRVSYSRLPYVPQPSGQQQQPQQQMPQQQPYQQQQRPRFQIQNPFQNPRFGNQSQRPVPWNPGMNPRPRISNFNGNPNYNPNLNPRPFNDQRQNREYNPNFRRNNQPNVHFQGNYQNQQRPQPHPDNRQQYVPSPEYLRDQAPVDGAIGNSGAQRPPPNVFINSARVQQSGQSQDARYQPNGNHYDSSGSQQGYYSPSESGTRRHRESRDHSQSN